MSSPGALVLGGDYRALGIARSLGAHGIPVWTIQEHDRLAGFSRHVRRRLRWPTDDEESRIGFLLQLAQHEGLDDWVMFPTTDETASFVSQHASELSDRFRLTTSAWEGHRTATNKVELYQRAAELGIAHPRTVHVSDEPDLDKIDMAFPLVLKPSQRSGRNAFTDAKAWRVDNSAELRRRFGQACELVGAANVMLQELIPGDGTTQLSFASVCRDGEPVAWLTAVRLRQFPMDFGRSSSYVITADIPEIDEPARRILADLQLTGPVEVEFKRDPRDGQAKLLDVNARVWGWHSLGVAAGVDISHTAWLMAQGQSTPHLVARNGVKWVRMSTDVPVAVAEMRAKTMSLRRYLRSVAPPIEGPIWSWTDPLPGLVELPMHALSVLRRRAESSRSRRQRSS